MYGRCILAVSATSRDFLPSKIGRLFHSACWFYLNTDHVNTAAVLQLLLDSDHDNRLLLPKKVFIFKRGGA